MTEKVWVGIIMGSQSDWETMKHAAEAGRDATKDLVAKKGRSSRLGKRSKGVLDAGACSCCLILGALADTSTALLQR